MRFLIAFAVVMSVGLCRFEPVWGATSSAWETASYAEYLKGRLSGLSLSSDGILRPGPPVRWEAALGQPALWSVALAPDGSTYAATGHSGKVFRITQDGKASPAWSAGQAEVFAIAVDQNGVVWAGSSPNGGVYRLAGDQTVEIWRSPEKYIWSIQPSPDGSLFVGTGEAGRIYHIDNKGKAQIYYETGQANVTALALGRNGQVYAGTEPNGLLYELTASGKGTILYDSTLPEIRSIVTDPNGNIYAAAMGGALSTRTGAASTAGVTYSGGTVAAATPTVITVTEAGDNAQAGAKAPPEKPATPATPTAPAATATVTEVSGVDKSAIYRIAPDRTIETLRTSREDNVYDLLFENGALMFSTDDHGRVYRWQDGKTTLLAELGTGEATRLLRTGEGWQVALSNPARVSALGRDGAGGGRKGIWYESQVHDSGNVARWGHILWRPAGKGIRFQTRTGNSLRPDGTWSAWADAVSGSSPDAIGSPVARYIQWRAEWSDSSNSTLNAVALSYLPQNAAPVVRSVSVTSVLGANAAKNAATAASSSAAYSITVTDSGEASAATSTTSGPSQNVSRLQSTQTQISWQADDPDGDKLVYSLYFRAEDATDWQLIRSRMYENTLLLDPDVLADGRYYFRVVASDGPANAEQYAKRTEFVSASVLVDNTPPAVTINAPRRNAMTADITAEATDQTSSLKRAEYSVDAGWWQPLEATDGITDTPHEQFRLHLEKLRPGEHLIVLRVYDTAGNAGLAKVLLQ